MTQLDGVATARRNPKLDPQPGDHIARIIGKKCWRRKVTGIDRGWINYKTKTRSSCTLLFDWQSWARTATVLEVGSVA